VDAFVYLRVAPGKIEDVVIALRGQRGIRHSVAVVGPWDVMVAVEAADFESIARTVLRDIQATEGVLHTYTAPVLPLEMLGVYAGGPGMPAMPMHRPGMACYVHIRAAAEAGSVAGVVQALGAMDDVAGVAVVAGEHDLIAEIPLTWEEAAPVILDKIHTIPGVWATTTLVAVPEFGQDADEDAEPFSTWA
jgi:DNA-binding Lrp family transcriptional regulator